MQGAFLEYAYSVIYSRALPDARDGLKPVQRRILYRCPRWACAPTAAHVKCARVVGEVMGKLHPHGDAPIYDALVRMAQPFTHAPAARRRPRQLRLARRRPRRLPVHRGAAGAGGAADDDGLDEDTVDFVPNYDDQLHAARGAARRLSRTCWSTARRGIAVGMATNMAPHNLVEVIGAARHLIAHPDGTLDDLHAVRARPRPAHAAARSSAWTASATPTRPAAAASAPAPPRASRTSRPRRKGIVVTELPYLVGPEKVIEKIKDCVQAKKLQGIADVKDLTDRAARPAPGHRDQERLQPGGRARAALPAHADGGLLRHQQRRAGRRPAAHARPEGAAARSTSTTASTSCAGAAEFRLRKREERLHLVEGLLIAILDIDEVIQVIRASDDAAIGRGAADGASSTCPRSRPTTSSTCRCAG